MSGTAVEQAPADIAGVRAPRPLLTPEIERELTARQRQVIEKLETLVVRGGLAEQTMAQIAAAANCSLRTLYGIAKSKDHLLLTIVDRRLQRIGRAAIAAITPAMQPLEALRVYLRAVNEAVQPTTAEFARDFADLEGGSQLLDAHENYVIAIVRNLLEQAVADQQIVPIDTIAVAHILGGLGREFARPRLLRRIGASPKDTADAVAEIILRGLEHRIAGGGVPPPPPGISEM